MASPHPPFFGWTLQNWQNAYRRGGLDPSLLQELVEGFDEGDPAWICVARREQISEQLDALKRRLAEAGGLDQLPLYGVPFAVKDNIDARGWPTTAACPDFSRDAAEDAPVVERLRTAGAILVGKTNLDQFATGLVGTRSPYGTVPSAFDPRYVGGGSSSGSASVVTRGLVPFALGTDTAGSGRVPAAFQNIVGLKPTRGLLSTRGVIPACRTLDCVSVFALTVADAELVFRLGEGYDNKDPYSRRRPPGTPRELGAEPCLGVPRDLEFFGDDVAARAFQKSLSVLTAEGASLVQVDFAPFHALAQLLYQGPWIAERAVVLDEWLHRSPPVVHPVVARVVEAARGYSASDFFRAEYLRAELARAIHEVLASCDALVVPSTPTTYTLSEVEADPIGTNSRLGTYTNFANLADLCALSLPGVFREDGLPAGVTLLAPAFSDRALARFGRRYERRSALPLGATGRAAPSEEPSGPADEGESVLLAVVGAHLRGMPLNHELTSRGARFVEAAHTASSYRLFALEGTHPPKPGLTRASSGGAIAVELWDVPLGELGSFVAGIPAPLGIGTLELEDGRRVLGFLCESWALSGARDITSFGGWRPYLTSLVTNPT